jgi:hypothetical protein
LGHFGLLPTYITDYTKGWTVDAQPAPGPLPNFPSDAPPGFVFAMLPTVYEFPFHYKNPVSGS